MINKGITCVDGFKTLIPKQDAKYIHKHVKEFINETTKQFDKCTYAVLQ